MGKRVRTRDGRGAGARSDRGQVVPLVAAVVGLVMLCIAGITRLGRTAVDRAQARTAADAAALAGAAERSESAARSVAVANGGRLVRYTAEGAEVEVKVVVGRASAVARARAEPGSGGGGPLG